MKIPVTVYEKLDNERSVSCFLNKNGEYTDSDIINVGGQVYVVSVVGGEDKGDE